MRKTRRKRLLSFLWSFRRGAEEGLFKGKFTIRKAGVLITENGELEEWFKHKKLRVKVFKIEEALEQL